MSLLTKLKLTIVGKISRTSRILRKRILKLCFFVFFFMERLHFCESARLLIPSTYAAYNVNLITKDNSAFLVFMSFFHFLLFQIFISERQLYLTRFVVFVYLLFYSEETEKKSLFFSLELKQRGLDFKSNSTLLKNFFKNILVTSLKLNKVWSLMYLWQNLK